MRGVGDPAGKNGDRLRLRLQREAQPLEPRRAVKREAARLLRDPLGAGIRAGKKTCRQRREIGGREQGQHRLAGGNDLVARTIRRGDEKRDRLVTKGQGAKRNLNRLVAYARLADIGHHRGRGSLPVAFSAPSAATDSLKEVLTVAPSRVYKPLAFLPKLIDLCLMPRRPGSIFSHRAVVRSALPCGAKPCNRFAIPIGSAANSTPP